MMNGLLWLIAGSLIGAIINAITLQRAEPYFILDVPAGSGGAFVTGLFFALLFSICITVAVQDAPPCSVNTTE